MGSRLICSRLFHGPLATFSFRVVCCLFAHVHFGRDVCEHSYVNSTTREARETSTFLRVCLWTSERVYFRGYFCTVENFPRYGLRKSSVAIFETLIWRRLFVFPGKLLESASDVVNVWNIQTRCCQSESTLCTDCIHIVKCNAPN